MWAVLIMQKYNWTWMGMWSNMAKCCFRYHPAFTHCSVLTFHKKMENCARLDFLPPLTIWTVFWPYLRIRMLVLCSELGYNTSLSLGPKSLTKALLTMLWPFWTFSSWSYKSFGLFPFPMEMAKVLFKYFPFVRHTFQHVSLLPPQLIWIEVNDVNEFIHLQDSA